MTTHVSSDGKEIYELKVSCTKFNIIYIIRSLCVDLKNAPIYVALDAFINA